MGAEQQRHQQHDGAPRLIYRIPEDRLMLSHYAVVAIAAASGLVTAEAQDAAAPWNVLAPGSATAAVIFVGFWLLRRESNIQTAHRAERAEDRARFTASLRDVTETLRDVTNALGDVR